MTLDPIRRPRADAGVHRLRRAAEAHVRRRDRDARDGRAWPARTPRPGEWSAWCTTSTTSAFPTPRTRPPRSTRPKGCGSWPQRGLPEPMQRAILGHATYTGVPRDTPMAKALFAVDELCGFLVACALVRPSRSLPDLEVSSVKKKLKDKAFARGREPRRRDPRGRGAGRAARRAHRVRARGAATARADRSGLGHGVTGASAADGGQPVGRAAPSTARPAGGRSRATRSSCSSTAPTPTRRCWS